MAPDSHSRTPKSTMDYFFPKEIIWNIDRSLCTKVFLFTSFILERDWKQPKNPALSVWLRCDGVPGNFTQPLMNDVDLESTEENIRSNAKQKTKKPQNPTQDQVPYIQ